MSANSEPEKVINPAQSSRLAPASAMLTIRDAATAIVTIPIGALTQKIHRHPSVSVRAPPTSGPTATATPTVAPHAAIALPRSRPSNSWPMSASPVANIAAPPMPWSARAAIRSAGSRAAPHATEAKMNTPRPTTNTVFRPKRSATDPHVRISAASVRAYASITHCISVKLPPSWRWIVGHP